MAENSQISSKSTKYWQNMTENSRIIGNQTTPLVQGWTYHKGDSFQWCFLVLSYTYDKLDELHMCYPGSE